jgi:Tfp pilus assembly protein PilO
VTQKVRLTLMALAIVIFAALIWFFVLSPIRGDIADVQTSIEEEQNLVMQANTRLKQAEATRAEGKRNQARLMELAKMVPLSEELPSLLLQIQDLADQSGIEFIQVTPGDAIASESTDFQIIPLALGFSGTYFDLSDFIYRAEQMVAGPGRLLAIKSVELGLTGEETGAAAGSPQLDVTMNIYAFILGGGQSQAVPVTPAPSTGTGGSSGTSTGSTQAQGAQ